MKWITLFLFILNLNLTSILGLKCQVCDYPGAVGDSEGEEGYACSVGSSGSVDCGAGGDTCKSIVKVDGNDQVIMAKRECVAGTGAALTCTNQPQSPPVTRTCYCSSEGCNDDKGYRKPTTTPKTTTEGSTEKDCTDIDGDCGLSSTIKILPPFLLIAALPAFQFLFYF